uniref:molybdopterin molybdotransferase n=1 Tax=Acrobeloides nanus TaxID=290746 RepID=A0A914EC77_9BILA
MGFHCSFSSNAAEVVGTELGSELLDSFDGVLKDTIEAMRVGVISISDSRSFDTGKEDVSGTLLLDLLNNSSKLGSVQISRYEIIPDEYDQIVNLLKAYISDSDVILTTGGTGFAPRDITPEATKSIIEKECPGIVTALMLKSLQATPFAALSRLAAGIVGKSLIVNLPGSPKAVRECFEVLEPILSHAVSLIKDEKETVQVTHSKLLGEKK